jgi:hypothetical protein
VALTAVARKEIAYLQRFGRAIQPFQRFHWDVHNYKAQSHLGHMATLEKHLQITPHIIPHGPIGPTLQRPTLRHPDLQFNNIFASEDLEISG